MISITGKTLVTTDWHFGLKSNSDQRLKILTTVTTQMARYMKENKIENFLFLGDWFHSRNNLSVQTINAAVNMLNAISRNCKNVYLILGNHDIFHKNRVDVNSMNIFKDTRNVHLIEYTTECDINGKRCLLVPWLGNMDYEKKTFDMIFGHFDINYRYLVSSFIEENARKSSTKEELRMLIEQDLMKDSSMEDSGMDDVDEILENKDETFVHRQKSSELIGEWIEIVKDRGTIFAGHIHGHKEFYAKKRRFIFVGSPYQQTRGEMKSANGFYIIDETGKYDFHELKGIPRFVDLRMSLILKNLDGFDFDIVRGNIIHKIYDVEVDRITEAKIDRKIFDRKPYEETTPDYMIFNTNSRTAIESLDAIKKSKLEYLQMYINSIDESVLAEKNINRDRLAEVASEYYNIVSEG